SLVFRYRRALRDEDHLDPAVPGPGGGVLARVERLGGAGAAGGDARLLDALLLHEVRLHRLGAPPGDDLGIALAAVGVADDDHPAARILPQAGGHVVQARLVDVVEAGEVPREATGGARDGLGAGHRRRPQAHAAGGGRGAAPAVRDAEGDRGGRARSHARALEGDRRAAADDAAGARAPLVGQGVSVGVGGVGADAHALTRQDLRALDLADGRRILVGGRRRRRRRRHVRLDLAAGEARVPADGDVAAGPALGAGVEAAIVEVEVTRDRGPDEEALDPEHGADHEVEGIGLVEVDVTRVLGAHQLGLELNRAAGGHVQADRPLQGVGDVDRVGIAVPLVAEGAVDVQLLVDVLGEDQVRSERRLAGAQALVLVGGRDLHEAADG